MIAAFIATILFSISIICGHRSASLIGGMEANFWRLACSTLLLGVWSYSFGLGLGGEAFLWFFVSGLIGFGVGDVALFQALPRLGAPLCSMITQCLGPPFAAVIEWMWLGTRITTQQTVFIVMILAGVSAALAPGRSGRLTKSRVTPVGLVWGLLAAAGTACGAVMSRKAFALSWEAGENIDGGNAAFQRVIAGLLVAGVTMLPVLWRKHGYTTRPQDLPSADVAVAKWRKLWPWVVGNSLAGSTIGISFMQWALSTTPTAIVLAIIATTPLAVIPLARIFEGEHTTRRAIAGAVIAVSGVVALLLVK